MGVTGCGQGSAWAIQPGMDRFAATGSCSFMEWVAARSMFSLTFSAWQIQGVMPSTSKEVRNCKDMPCCMGAEIRSLLGTAQFPNQAAPPHPRRDQAKLRASFFLCYHTLLFSEHPPLLCLKGFCCGLSAACPPCCCCCSRPEPRAISGGIGRQHQ